MYSFTANSTMEGAIPVTIISPQNYDDWHAAQSDEVKRWLTSINFIPCANHTAMIPVNSGSSTRAIVVYESDLNKLTSTPWGLASLPTLLKYGRYYLDHELSPSQALNAAYGWALEAYRFTSYKSSSSQTQAVISTPKTCNILELERLVRAHCWARDMINAPASDFGPDELEKEAKKIADAFNGVLNIVAGEALLTQNFPLIHSVGRASDRTPRLIDLTFQNSKGPNVTIIGKGVCFDTGGLNLKNAAGMRHMKIDMGGAAQALALAYMALSSSLPINLRVLIPAVDNNISANAYRPGDIVKARNGIFVEVGNTDAEGRLTLADALAYADEDHPDLIIDFATLTGACEIALGPDIPAILTSDFNAATTLLEIGREVADPVWPLPLWEDYEERLKSKYADTNNIAEGFTAGSIIGGLFLKKFSKNAGQYIHVDYTGLNENDRPGRPAGGEVQGLRSIYEYLRRLADKHGM